MALRGVAMSPHHNSAVDGGRREGKRDSPRALPLSEGPREHMVTKILLH